MTGKYVTNNMFNYNYKLKIGQVINKHLKPYILYCAVKLK